VGPGTPGPLAVGPVRRVEFEAVGAGDVGCQVNDWPVADGDVAVGGGASRSRQANDTSGSGARRASVTDSPTWTNRVGRGGAYPHGAPGVAWVLRSRECVKQNYTKVITRRHRWRGNEPTGRAERLQAPSGSRLPLPRRTTHDGRAVLRPRRTLVHVDADGAVRDFSYPLVGLTGVARSRFGVRPAGEPAAENSVVRRRCQRAALPRRHTGAGGHRPRDALRYRLPVHDLTLDDRHVSHFDAGAASEPLDVVACVGFAPDGRDNRLAQLPPRRFGRGVPRRRDGLPGERDGVRDGPGRRLRGFESARRRGHRLPA